jgi:hypothetical protein
MFRVATRAAIGGTVASSMAQEKGAPVCSGTYRRADRIAPPTTPKQKISMAQMAGPGMSDVGPAARGALRCDGLSSPSAVAQTTLPGFSFPLPGSTMFAAWLVTASVSNRLAVAANMAILVIPSPSLARTAQVRAEPMLASAACRAAGVLMLQTI